MPRDVWSTFAADRVDHRELQTIIGRHFPSSSQPAPNEVIYPGTEPFAIKLVFSKSDELTKIESGPSLTPELERRIQTAIHDALLTPNGIQVFRRVLFADQPLHGTWRYRDWFQILAVPSDAPHLDCLIGDHPFILEIAVNRSTDALITVLRLSRVAREVELLLAGLVQGSIHSIPSGFRWVLLRPPEQQQVAYLQEYYAAPTIAHQSEAFSEGTVAAPIVPAGLLFAPYGISGGQPLAIPDSLSESLGVYESLDAGERQRFLRACYWLQHASRVFPNSFSAAFMSAVTAAESLSEHPPEVCPTCGKLRYGLGVAFARWLDTCVPLNELATRNSSETRRFRDRLKHLYGRRSTLTHGDGLLGHDKDLVMHMTPLRNIEDHDLRTLMRVMHMALATWLVRKPAAVATNREPSLFELVLRWCAARMGNARTRLIDAAESVAYRRADSRRP